MEALVRETSRGMRWTASVAVAAMLAASPRVAAAEPSTSAAARLEVDTSELGGIGPVLKERLLERGAQVLRDGEISSGGPTDPIVRVTVKELGGEDPGFDYEIRLVANSSDDGASWSERCTLCTEAELVDAVAAELDKVAGSIRALDPQEPEPPPPVIEPTVEPGPQPTDDPDLPTKAKVGIGVLAVGVVAAGVGVGLILAPARPLPGDPLQERYTQPPGFATVAVGGAAVVAGAVLLGLGLRERKGARSSARLSPGGLTLRF